MIRITELPALLLLAAGLPFSCSPEHTVQATQTSSPEKGIPAPTKEIQDQKPAIAAEKSTETKSEFARFVKTGEDEGRFETSITRYENAKGQRVSLIAAVHIADAEHYDDLNQDFTTYDALLYELVAPEGHRPKPGEKRSKGGLSILQTLLKNALELEFQLDRIDYSPDNFVHADLTPSGFQEKMKERGESILTFFLTSMQRQMDYMRKNADERENTPPEKFDLVSAFRSGYGRHSLRMMFAKQLKNLEAMAGGGDLDDENGGTVLLEGRNQRALEVLQEQLLKGKKDLGIYYGAAHMPGIERSLQKRMGFKKVEEKWLIAWDISKRPDKPKKSK
ncbi:MAG: hypothetical protein QF412_05195 [Planctomycetota bacterium]|nr:hypothetical protein [Planctomycetota bacterium]